jgi:acyl carrier protein
MAVLTLDSVAQKIAELAALTMGKDPSAIERGEPLDSQGVDSLGFAEFIFEVEDSFGVELSDREKVLPGLRTINDLAAYIVQQKSTAAA